MASTATKRPRSTAPKKTSKPLVSPARKLELLGLILMAVAVLVGLAVLSYSPSDDSLAREFTFASAFSPEENRANNLLGLFGAGIAYLLVPSFLGYPIVLLPALLLLVGYATLRHRHPDHSLLIASLTGVGVLATACLFGWIGIVSEADLQAWSGSWGGAIALWLRHAFGLAGAFILLMLALSVITLMFVDRDIQRTMDRLEGAAASLRDRWNAWRAEREEIRAEREAEEATLQEKREREQEAREMGRPSGNGARSTAPPAVHPSPRPSSQPTLNDVLGGRAAASPPRPAAEPKPPAPAPPPPEPPKPRPAPVAPPPGGLELQVRERIEEERVDEIERDASDIPNRVVPFRFPTIDLLEDRAEGELDIDYSELEENKQILLDKLSTYNIELTAINAIVGPTVTLYELTPAPGIKISRITALEDDLAMAMAARGIRMIAPIPGKTAVGVEIPNRHRELVRVRDVLGTARFRDTKMELPVPIGKTIEGEVFIEDLTKMPHLLVAGATGSGKSVGINTLISGLMYACHPSNLKFVIIDPKKIELQQYARVSEHYIAMPTGSTDPIITDFMQALGVLKSCEKEMERRYDLLSKATVRGVKDYNKKFQQGLLPETEGHRHLPYLVVVVDELADLMMTAGKEIEGPIARLAQMARAVGIHLVLATQRPSVDVITGLIKANFPARIAYQVASKVDSRTILDQNGAEGLVGNGDLLYMLGSRVIRLQGPFISVDEVDHIVNFIADQDGPGPYYLPELEEAASGDGDTVFGDDTDDLFDEAARIIVRSQQGSVSLLQRKLSVGYTRAARIVDQLEEAGIVGPFEGSKARQVLVDTEFMLEEMLKRRDEE
jgi:DNA segregation ATPase FtsK/SpoIIIE, S-DNA-T family